jgi:SAM-dependent methyltransferase
MTSKIVEKARHGVRWTPQEANDFLRAFHASRPGITALSVDENRDPLGRTSYDLTAAAVPLTALSVLDLACGDGVLLLAIARRLEARAELIGVDLSAVDVTLAKGRLADFRAKVLCESVERLSLAGESIDVVVSHFALMLIRPLESVLAEVARVLRPGGLFVACVPQGISVDRSSAETRRLLLEIIRTDVPEYPDTGLGDSRAVADDSLTVLLEAAGFEPPSFETHSLVCELAPEVMLRRFRSYYWWDLIREETRARFDREILPLLEREAAATGTVRQASHVRMMKAETRLAP